MKKVKPWVVAILIAIGFGAITTAQPVMVISRTMAFTNG